MRIRAWLAVAPCVLVMACGGSDLATPDGVQQSVSPPQQTPAVPPPTAEPSPTETIPPGEQQPLSIVGPDGEEVVFSVEVVAEPAARQQGLMHRTDLADDAGMLFLFPAEHTGGFWMKNTLIPLSIAFLDEDGEILRILDMEPCEADPCPSYEPGVAYHAALEVNAGAFDDAGVSTGWRVDLEGLPTAS